MHINTREQYIRETVRVWLGLPLGGEAASPLPAALERRFLREEELEHDHRDQWGNWEFAFSESFADGMLVVPTVDRWLATERSRLTSAGQPLVPLWPDGKRFAVCLTHDVDLVSTAFTTRQAMRSMQMSLARESDMQRRERLIRWVRPPVRLARAARAGIRGAPDMGPTMERSVEIEREAGVTASYFFTVPPHPASRYDCVYDVRDFCTFRGKRRRIADVLTELASEGFDIGLHGSYHSATTSGLLSAQRAALAEATGLDIVTTRQHFLHWDIRSTPRLQADAGLQADSTLGFNRGVGFRAGTSLPYFQYDHEADAVLDLIQVPLIIQDGPLFNAAGLELDTGMAADLVRRIMDEIAEVGGTATFLFHPNNLLRDDFQQVFKTTIDYAVDRGAWVASLAQIQKWWRERAMGLSA